MRREIRRMLGWVMVGMMTFVIGWAASAEAAPPH